MKHMEEGEKDKRKFNRDRIKPDTRKTANKDNKDE